MDYYFFNNPVYPLFRNCVQHGTLLQALRARRNLICYQQHSYAFCNLGITGISPCFAITNFNFSRSGGPPAFTMSPTSLKKIGPSNAGVITARALASWLFRFSKPCTAPRGIKQVSPGAMSTGLP